MLSAVRISFIDRERERTIDAKQSEHHFNAISFFQIVKCVCSNQMSISQVFLNDSNINGKLDFSKPINFLTHGWLSGLLDRNMHLRGFNETPNEYDGIYIT